MSLKVIEQGVHTTIQDLGRYGYRSLGFPVNGPMDDYAMQLANFLVGNEASEAVLEMSVIGPTIECMTDTVIAITGADMSANINEQLIPYGKAVAVSAGDVIQLRTAKTGIYGYLAIKGGINVESLLGSKSTIVRADHDHLLTRPLQNGDEIPIRSAIVSTGQQPSYINPEVFDYITTSYPVIHYMEGAQYEWFDEKTKQLFEQIDWQISSQSNRMGYRINGGRLHYPQDKQLLTEATSFGAIQVPPSGEPIVLMADGQPTGGYPKIGQIAQVDLPKLSQLRPGQPFQLKKCTLNDAMEWLYERDRFLTMMQKLTNQLWKEV
ncbi:allophanate hydrolase subunit 2 [Gracilibacillus halophilus YIM-C55.5]|uniref:Allophanate hydrolase subunit 2 n=1 Tax=Gracilibacillus halophilus YIM-C55.5 TaxID=1308866 RepID=N4WQG5_9BACI|nr:biotin-dependent carboxyltransferase family protein [Gracilibacillus halophilus]ENH98372.1 allophanate hydrolase subunit 2 [Gracilibacillus halophilus YIM-C55.5]